MLLGSIARIEYEGIVLPANIETSLGIRAPAGMIQGSIKLAIQNKSTTRRITRVKNGSLLSHARTRAGFGSLSATAFVAMYRESRGGRTGRAQVAQSKQAEAG